MVLYSLTNTPSLNHQLSMKEEEAQILCTCPLRNADLSCFQSTCLDNFEATIYWKFLKFKSWILKEIKQIKFPIDGCMKVFK